MSTGGSSKSAYVLIYEKRVNKDIRMVVDAETVKKQGKTEQQIQEDIQEEKRKYIASIYSSYDSKYSNVAQSDSDTKEDSKMEPNEATFKSSLECGAIALPRELFPLLVFPHNSYIFYNREEKDKVKYIPVEYNKDSDECIIKVKVNEVHKYVPYRIFKKVWDDNNSFSSERQLNNIDFFQFFKKTLSCENIVEQQDNQEKLALLYDLSMKMIYNMLVYAYNNETINEVADVLKKVLSLSDTAIVEFADFILVDDASEFLRILYKCSDASVREAVCTILSTGINRMFGRVDLIEKAEKFMTIMINSINTEAANNWTKFEHFFALIKNVTIGGDAQLDFMRKNNLETVLADFFLAERSPIRPPDEKRICMGNNYSKPIYDSLIQTICYISRHTDPRNDIEQDTLPDTILGNQLYKPNENEAKVIVNKHFAVRAIKDSFEADSVGKLIAHWSHNHEENSIVFAGVFLAGINETDYEEVAPFLTAMHHFLKIEDSLQSKRIEWLMGVPMLVDGCIMKACPPDFPKLGVYAINALPDEVFYFPTTLEHVDSVNESILSLIYRSRQRFEGYTLF